MTSSAISGRSAPRIGRRVRRSRACRRRPATCTASAVNPFVPLAIANRVRRRQGCRVPDRRARMRARTRRPRRCSPTRRRRTLRDTSMSSKSVHMRPLDQSGGPYPRLVMASAHLRDPHLRVPDERARLRAARRAARGRRLRARRRGTPGPRRVQHLRGARERRQPAVRQPRHTCTRSRPSTPTCRSPSAAASHRRTAAASSRRRPWVDVVFGTHNLASLPVLLERARHNRRPQVEIVEALQNFPSDLPTRRQSAYSAWVSISVGCDNTCTFCIVPSLRGRENDRRPGDVLAEIRALVDAGVVEVTLLGQNVNSYGRSFGDRFAFGKLLRACGDDRRARTGAVHQPAPARLHRRRHRRDGRDAERDAAAAHADAVRLGRGAQGDAPLLPAGALPRRSSTRCAPRCRTPRSPPTSSSASPARPRPTSSRPWTRCAPARFASAFTFQYSPRPGHARRDDARPGPEAGRAGALRPAGRRAGRDRLGRGDKALVGREVEVLVSRGEGRKDGATGRVSGPRPRRPARARGAAPRARRPSSPPRSPTPPRTISSPTPASRTRRPLARAPAHRTRRSSC